MANHENAPPPLSFGSAAVKSARRPSSPSARNAAERLGANSPGRARSLRETTTPSPERRWSRPPARGPGPRECCAPAEATGKRAARPRHPRGWQPPQWDRAAHQRATPQARARLAARRRRPQPWRRGQPRGRRRSRPLAGPENRPRRRRKQQGGRSCVSVRARGRCPWRAGDCPALLHRAAAGLQDCSTARQPPGVHAPKFQQ